MSTNKTQHYQLNQWEAEDKVLRSEFNQDNRTIDEALSGLAGQTAGKAERVDVEALSFQVASKASQSALDALARTVPRYAAGAYTGDGTQTRIITLPFTPKAVLVCTSYGKIYKEHNTVLRYHGGLAVTDSPAVTNDGDMELVSVQSGGFQVHCDPSDSRTYINTNVEGEVYHYIALG